VLNGTATLTAEMALRFARLTGGEPELYLGMQVGYDLEAAQRRIEHADIEPAPEHRPSAAISTGNKGNYVVEELFAEVGDGMKG
jgi:plasmid maintenance system antidote protein VapI